MRLRERPPKGRLAARVSPSRHQKIDRLPTAVDRPIEIGPVPLHANIGFVHPPGAIAYPQMRADPFLKLLGIGLDPTEDRRVIHLDTAVDEHELEVAVTDREHQIPTNGPQNHFRCELTPLEATAAPIHCPATPYPDRGRYTRNTATGETCNRTSGGPFPRRLTGAPQRGDQAANLCRAHLPQR